LSRPDPRHYKGALMTESLPDRPLPDRLSNDPRSPHHDAALLERGVGIRFNGVEKTNVEEYCVSEGWIRIAAGKARDRHGNPMTIKLKGVVEPYVRVEDEK
jgi:hypothetical protein